MKVLLTPLIFFIPIILFAQETHSPLWCDLKPGQYDVGFKVEYLIDSSRIMKSTDSLPHSIEGRPIRVKVYYPGEKETASHQLSFLDQINIFPENHQLATYNNILNRRDRNLRGQFSPPSDSLAEVLFDMPTMAYRTIPHADGKYPLLIYALGLDDHQMENSVLWEYLASHGYVIAVLPCFGIGLERIDVPYTQQGVTNLYDDAAYVLRVMMFKSYVNATKVGTIGHSFGGLIASMLAAKQHSIKAIASLDGSINLERGLKIMDSLNINATTIKAPLLNLYANSPDRILTFSEAIDAPVYQIRFTKANHYDFQNFGLFGFVTNTSDKRLEKRRTSEEAKEYLLSMIRLTKNFFNYTLLGDNAGKNFISDKSNDPIFTDKIAVIKMKE